MALDARAASEAIFIIGDGNDELARSKTSGKGMPEVRDGKVAPTALGEVGGDARLIRRRARRPGAPRLG